MEKSKSRMEWVRFGAVLIVLAFALLADSPLAAFFVSVGLSAMLAPVLAFLIAALIGYFILFTLPHSYAKRKK